MDASIESPRLPVFRTALKAWGSVPANIGLMARLYWPWLAIVIVTLLAWGAGIIVNSGFAAPSAVLVGGAGWVPLIALLIALVIAVPAIFVGWHRGIQTGERPTQPILIDSAVWAYIGYSVLIGITLVLTVVLFGTIATAVVGISTGLGDGPMSLERFAALAPFLPPAIVPYYLLLSRFSLVLPAVAVGQSMTLSDSFRKTRGNTWRLTLGAGLIYLPVVILSGLLEIVNIAFPGSPAIVGPVSILVLIASVYCMHAALSFGTMALKRLAPTEPMTA
jgi:hypothetical protein